MTITICFASFVLTSQVFAQGRNAPAHLNNTEGYIVLAKEFEQMAQDEAFTDFYFNAACYWTLVDDVENAFRCLQRAANEGFRFLEWMVNEDDLKNLHRDGRWQVLIKAVKLNQRNFELEKERVFIISNSAESGKI